MRREAREEQPSVFRREDAEQLFDRCAPFLPVRFFAPLNDYENALPAAGFSGTVTGRLLLHERRTAKGVGQMVPRSTGIPVKGVEIEIQQAVHVRAVGEITGVLAGDVFLCLSRQRRLPHPGRADDRGVLSMAQTLDELRSLGVAAEELLGRQRQLARDGRTFRGLLAAIDSHDDFTPLCGRWLRKRHGVPQRGYDRRR